MANSFDLIVVGGGPAGYVGAIRASQLGLRTALVERDKVGGTCLHVGCIPTKVLLHTAERLEEMREGSEIGIVADNVRLDLDLLYKRKDRVVTTNFRGVEYLMRKNKIAVFPGQARLTGSTGVHVSAADGSETDLEARRILVATGSRPRDLPGARLDHDRIVDSTGALALRAVPRSIAILGAGAVGTEFASIFAAFGSEVTLIELLPSVLPMEDEECAAVVGKALERRGVRVRTGTAVTGAQPCGDGVRVTMRTGDGPEESIETEYVLVAVGRAPLTDGLGLEEAGVEVGRTGITVNAQMQTSVPSVYAAGDVIGGLLLAHVGSAEAEVAVEAIAGESPRPLDQSLMPRATFCIPQLASVGLTERQARDAGRDVSIGRFPFTGNARAAILGRREGLIKIVADRELGEILGVHLVGPEVTELLPEGVLARGLEATVVEIGQSVHAHPTLSEAVREAALAALGRAVHG